MNFDVTMIVLRLIHILAGIFWTGATILLARFLLPSLRVIGPSGGALMREMAQQRRLPQALNFAGLFTILSGFGMYWRLTAQSNGVWASSRPAMVYGAGAVFALVAAVVGNVISRPTAKRIAALGAEIAAGGAPTQEQQSELAALQTRMHSGTRMVAILLVLAAACMAVARYV